MGSQPDKEYSEFILKMKKTVFVDNVSTQITVPVIKNAFGQFGSVVNVSFIPNYLGPKNASRCILVEMEDEKEADSVVSETSDFPFMMGGMPRPVRCQKAEPEMFSERPPKPGRRIACRWLEPSDPDFEVAKRLKNLVKRHDAETFALHKIQLEEEVTLARKQEETLKSSYKKFEMIESIANDGTIKRLGDRYGMQIRED